MQKGGGDAHRMWGEENANIDRHRVGTKGNEQTVLVVPASHAASLVWAPLAEGYLEHLQISCCYCNLGAPCVLKLVALTFF